MTREQLRILAGIQEFVSNEWVLKQFGLTMEEIEMTIPEKRKAFIEKCSDPSYEITEYDEKLLEQIYQS